MERKEKKWFVVMTETKDGTDRSLVVVFINERDLYTKIRDFIEECVLLFGIECYVYRIELAFFQNEKDRDKMVSKLIECKRYQKAWIKDVLKMSWSSKHRSDAQKKRHALKKQQEEQKEQNDFKGVLTDDNLVNE